MSDSKETLNEDTSKELVKKDIDGLAKLVFKNRQDFDEDDETDELATLVDLIQADISSIHDTLGELRSQIQKIQKKNHIKIQKTESKKNNTPNSESRSGTKLGNFSLDDDDEIYKKTILLSQKEH